MLLGASNLSRVFPRAIEALRATQRGPLDAYVAMGFGRSYGQVSKFFSKKLLGILQSALWSALDHATPIETSAIIADVGNDLAYQTSVDALVEWVREALDRLAAHRARVVLNNVPIESLRAVGPLRYHAVRTVLFPGCSIPYREMLRRVEELHARLEELARTREIPVFSAAGAWYGVDPIHPRTAHSGAIWQRMIGALGAPDAHVPWRAPALSDQRALRWLQTRSWALGRAHGASPPQGTQLRDGSTITLF
ncbi:MAG TPA: hypothetical protein VEQ85_07950 [Lacipirellulaceae bacterium]|nr:hypothetical protein [Lacipirellulaceae bacterium]